MDVKEVQDAVNQGDRSSFACILVRYPARRRQRNRHGYSFAGSPFSGEVKITKAVSISGGERDDDAATIDGGTVPFYVEAPGHAVGIRGLRFVRPISHAVLVYAVQGLEIASNRIEGLKTFSST